MAIPFQCKHCGKKIEAPDKLAGKRGKCPKCRATLVIPDPAQAEDVPLRLQPLDSEEEQERHRLWSETYNVTQAVLSESTVPEDVPAEPDTPSDPTDISYMISATPMGTEELKQNILQYFQLLAGGDQDQASQYEQLILPHGDQAIEILDSIALNDLPEPELASIPSHTLSGLIRDLRTQINS
ncbi:MAG: hypothetical protein GY809_30635 [Planctomycetes bacterium]|nr:hypothetical protein [Planctomycetota bacterium]